MNECEHKDIDYDPRPEREGWAVCLDCDADLDPLHTRLLEKIKELVNEKHELEIMLSIEGTTLNDIKRLIGK